MANVTASDSNASDSNASGSNADDEEQFGYKAYVDAILMYATKQKIPNQVYNSTRELATTIASKMRIYSDAMSGKNDPSNVSILLQHYNVIESLRSNEPEKYKQLVFFSTIYPTLSYDDQRVQILAFFNGF
jgi:hypothetical protein